MTDSVDRVDAGAGQDRLPGTQVDFFLKGDAPGDKAGGKAGGRAGGKAGKGTRPPTNSPTRAPNAPMHSPTSAPTRSPGGKKAGKKCVGGLASPGPSPLGLGAWLLGILAGADAFGLRCL